MGNYTQYPVINHTGKGKKKKKLEADLCRLGKSEEPWPIHGTHRALSAHQRRVELNSTSLLLSYHSDYWPTTTLSPKWHTNNFISKQSKQYLYFVDDFLILEGSGLGCLSVPHQWNLMLSYPSGRGVHSFLVPGTFFPLFPFSLAEDLALFCQHYLLLEKRTMGCGTHSLLPGLRILINGYQFQHFVSVWTA